MTDVESFMFLDFVNPLFGPFSLMKVYILAKTMFKYKKKSGPSLYSRPHSNKFQPHCCKIIDVGIQDIKLIKIGEMIK